MHIGFYTRWFPVTCLWATAYGCYSVAHMECGEIFMILGTINVVCGVLLLLEKE